MSAQVIQLSRPIKPWEKLLAALVKKDMKPSKPLLCKGVKKQIINTKRKKSYMRNSGKKW